jgi:hypothetical protein
MVDLGSEIIYVLYIVCQELSNTIYVALIPFANSLIKNKH